MIFDKTVEDVTVENLDVVEALVAVDTIVSVYIFVVLDNADELIVSVAVVEISVFVVEVNSTVFVTAIFVVDFNEEFKDIDVKTDDSVKM